MRNVKFSDDHKTLLIGTYGSEIFEITTKDSAISSKTVWEVSRRRMTGHYTPN